MPSEFDLRIIVGFAAAMGSLALALALAEARRDREGGPMARSALAIAALLAAAIGMMLRGAVPLPVSAFVANAGLTVGLCLAYAACLTALSRPAPVAALAAIPAAMTLAATGMALGGPEPMGPAAVLAFAQMLLAAAMAAGILRVRGAASTRRLAFVMAPFCLLAAVQAGRLAALLSTPEPPVWAAGIAALAFALGAAAVLLVFGLISLRQEALINELASARASAETANRAKSDFLRSMSHELRTPLNAVIGLSELMKAEVMGPLPEPYRAHVTHIRASGGHLLELIDDLLDTAVIDAGRFTMQEQRVPLDPVVAAALAMIRPRADAAGITLTDGRRVPLPAVLGDRRRLLQILLNLLANAVKFTPAGGRVTLAAGPTASDGVTVRISDTGPGLTPDEAEAAMRPFVRIGRVAGPGTEGTGIGLPLSRELARIHDGDVTLESTPGWGTVAILCLPAARVIGPGDPREAAFAPASATVRVPEAGPAQPPVCNRAG